MGGLCQQQVRASQLGGAGGGGWPLGARQSQVGREGSQDRRGHKGIPNS